MGSSRNKCLFGIFIDLKLNSLKRNINSSDTTLDCVDKNNDTSSEPELESPPSTASSISE